LKLFHKLFVTYLFVALLALLISGAFAGYMIYSSSGTAQAKQLQGYGEVLADRMMDQEWNPDLLSRVKATIERLDHFQSANIWLIDRDGVVRLSSNSILVHPSQRLTSEALSQALSGSTYVRLLPSRPRGRVPAVVVPVRSNNMVVGAVLLLPTMETIRTVRFDILQFILYGALVATVVVALLSYFVSSRISRSAAAVSAAAERLARGDFSSRVETTSNDEIGRLAQTFNQMAQELDRLEINRKELMANVSHELKGPLARIAGYLEAIHDGMGDEEARRQHFAIVRRETGRLTRLVNDLLDYSRLEAGRLQLHPIPCDLAPYLIRAAEVFQAPAATSGVSLQILVPHTLPLVLVEPERIEQVVVNLLENGLSFTGRGGELRLTAQEQDGWLTIAVIDQGPGIAQTELPHVWERFYKVDPARTPGRRGFGLGLTIVKQLVELHGGEVFVTSNVGTGSCFGFRVPLAKPE
jgi:signal transduction histidine kinase